MRLSWMTMAAGILLAAGALPAQVADPVEGPQAGQRLRRTMMKKRAANLNLTPEQIRQIQAIRQEARTAAQPVVAQLKTGRQHLAEAVKTGSQQDIERLATQQGVLQGQMVAIRSKAQAKVYALLTPEQRQKADRFRGRFQRMMRNRAGGV